MINNVQMSDSIGALVAAVARFQAELPKVAKSNTADVQSQRGHYKYQYADLTDVSEATLPKLSAQGLAWITMPNTGDDGTLYLDWMLAHESGEHIRGSVPIGSRGDQWQTIGTAETYARRYCLIALTGVAPGGDDNDGQDARAGQSRQEPAAPVQPPMLPEGLYDTSTLRTRKDAEQMFYAARAAGHLGYAFALEDGTLIPFADYLRQRGGTLPESLPEDESQDPDDPEEAERRAIAEHEAALAAEAERAADAEGGEQ